MFKRICFSCLLLVSVLFLPFWLSVILALFGMFYFSNYWEAVVLFFASDLLFEVKEARFFNLTLVSSFASLLVLLLVGYLKKKLKFYRN
jgi:hypothetical protein